MNHVFIATSEGDARAAEAVAQHHVEVAAALARRSEALVVPTTRQEAESAEAARKELLAWCEVELVPHAFAMVERHFPGMFAVDCLEHGSDDWRQAFVRTDRSALGKEHAGADGV